MPASPPWARGSLAAAALAAAAAGQDATPTPPAARYTWGNCKCKVNWEEDGKKCSKGCCNFDDGGDEDYDGYCYVEDQDCEFFEWGFCRPETMSTAGCTDYPPDWTDSDGDDCWAYSFNEFCTSSGGLGEEWDETWGTFQSFTRAGHDASTACCACGGGIDTFQGFNDKRCADTVGWKDSDGDDCETYSENFFCTSDKEPGFGWHDEWGALSSFKVNGVSAFDACCACGGGVEGTYEGTQYTPRPNGDTAGVKVPSGVAWAVASGPCTKDSSDCILSPNYPKPYGNDEKCVIGVNPEQIFFVTAEPFETEWGYDTLMINGQLYSGTMGPEFVWPLEAIVWTSDYEGVTDGWRLCRESPEDAARAGAKMPISLTRNQAKGVGAVLVLGIVGAVACACWCKMRKAAPPSGMGQGVPQDESY